MASEAGPKGDNRRESGHWVKEGDPLLPRITSLGATGPRAGFTRSRHIMGHLCGVGGKWLENTRLLLHGIFLASPP